MVKILIIIISTITTISITTIIEAIMFTNTIVAKFIKELITNLKQVQM